MKKFWRNKIVAVCLLVVLLAFGAAACEKQTPSLTELLVEVNSLPQIAAEGEVYISIHDLGMELDFAEDGLPADLLQDTTINYQISCDNEADLAEVHLTADFACYDAPLALTLFVESDCIYFNQQDLLKLFEVFADPDDYAEAQTQLAGYEWVAWPLEKDFAITYYDDISEEDLQLLLDEVEKFRSTIGQAYKGFSVKSMTVNGSNFLLELDNAGLADLINDLISYTLDNFEAISQAYIDYINISSLFEAYDREDMIEVVQELVEAVKEITPQQRSYVETTIKETLIDECPMDFNIKYNFAKTAADTYTLDEQLSIVFSEVFYGEPSDVLISIKNTSKAVENLQITLPTENIFYLEDM